MSILKLRLTRVELISNLCKTMERLKNHTYTSDQFTDEILAKMDKFKINKSQVIRNAIKRYYFDEIEPLEKRLKHMAKNGDCPW